MFCQIIPATSVTREVPLRGFLVTCSGVVEFWITDINTCTYMQAQILIHLYTHICIHVCVCIYTCIYIYMHMHIHLHTDIHTPRHIHVCSICVYIYMYKASNSMARVISRATGLKNARTRKESSLNACFLKHCHSCALLEELD